MLPPMVSDAGCRRGYVGGMASHVLPADTSIILVQWTTLDEEAGIDLVGGQRVPGSHMPARRVIPERVHRRRGGHCRSRCGGRCWKSWSRTGCAMPKLRRVYAICFWEPRICLCWRPCRCCGRLEHYGQARAALPVVAFTVCFVGERSCVTRESCYAWVDTARAVSRMDIDILKLLVLTREDLE